MVTVTPEVCITPPIHQEDSSVLLTCNMRTCLTSTITMIVGAI